jgi:hypothetical protein
MKMETIGEGKRLAIIAICNLNVVQSQAYATHLIFAYRLAKDNPDFRFILFNPYRMSIANFRNYAAKAALESGAEYLMFLDDDAVLVNNGSIFKDLIDKIDNEENKHIISPVVYVRGYPFDPMFFKFLKEEDMLKEGKGMDFYRDFRDQEVGEDNLLKVEAVGCHCCLIKTEVFKFIPKPFFLTTTNNTEDVYFCLKCHDYIENLGIYIDVSLTAGHLIDPIYIHEGNADLIKEFYKKLGFEKITDPNTFFRQEMRVELELDQMGEDFEL